MQLRAAYFLTVAVIAVGLVHFFLYLQETQMREDYLTRILKDNSDWKTRLQELEARSSVSHFIPLATTPSSFNIVAVELSGSHGESRTRNELSDTPTTIAVAHTKATTTENRETKVATPSTKSVDAPTIEELSPSTKSVDAPTIEELSPSTKSVDAPTIEELSPSTKSVDAPTIKPLKPNTKSVDAPTIEELSPSTKSVDAPTIEEVSPSTKSVDAPTIEELSPSTKSVDSSTMKQKVHAGLDLKRHVEAAPETKGNVSHQRLHLLSIPNVNEEEDSHRQQQTDGPLKTGILSHSQPKILPFEPGQTTTTSTLKSDRGKNIHYTHTYSPKPTVPTQHYYSTETPNRRTVRYFVGPDGKYIHETSDVTPAPGVRSIALEYADYKAHRRIYNVTREKYYSINTIRRARYPLSKWGTPTEMSTSPPMNLTKCNANPRRYMFASNYFSRQDYMSTEIPVVYQNLDKCLAAAELTDYFNNKSYSDTSRQNAMSLFLMVREVVPANATTSNGKALCWKSDFNIQMCHWIINGNISAKFKGIQGHIGNIAFKASEATCTYETRQALRNIYKGHASSPLLCMPSVFVAGFPKCGSSFVYCLVNKLARMAHPGYRDSQIEKEPHFWVRTGPHFHHQYPIQYSDIAKYVFNFLPAARRQPSNYTLPIDGSPNLLFQWPHFSSQEVFENYCLLPAILPQILPDSKYIVVLRDPVMMLYSAFWFSCSTQCPSMPRVRQEKGPRIFHERVTQKIKIFKNCSLYKPIDACMVDIFLPLNDTTHEFGSRMCGRIRLEVGFYYLYIRRWLAVLPREKFLFLTTEELHRDFSGVSQQISDFLGLGLNVDALGSAFNSSLVSSCKNVQSRFDYHGDSALQMRNDTRRLLYDFFDPFNQKLSELLQDRKYLWRPKQF